MLNLEECRGIGSFGEVCLAFMADALLYLDYTCLIVIYYDRITKRITDKQSLYTGRI